MTTSFTVTHSVDCLTHVDIMGETVVMAIVNLVTTGKGKRAKTTEIVCAVHRMPLFALKVKEACTMSLAELTNGAFEGC